MKLILLHGLARSGKDTSADFLEVFLKKEGYKYKRTAFAYTLKKVCGVLFNMSLEEIEKHKEDPIDWVESKITPRRFLQHFGTEYIRNNVDKDFWLKCVEQQMDDSLDYMIITDCRFPNELEMKNKYDTISIKVKRGNADKISTTGHASEQGLDDDLFDHVIENNGSLEDLKVKITSIFI